MITAHFSNLFIVKIYCFITATFYFGFKKFFIVDRFAMKFFFNISADLS